MSEPSNPGGIAMWWPNVRPRDWTWTGPSSQALKFHRSLAGYQPTALIDLPSAADELGVARVVAKDESMRLGLPAFKALGASWAIHRVLAERESNSPATIVTATDGNHGRAVARFARLLGHRSVIVIPDGVHPSAVQAIRDEGGDVRVLSGSYDHAVAAAAELAQTPDAILVQDTAWPGYEEIPGWIVEGYATLFAEADQQLRDLGSDSVSAVFVPTGVGSLLQAALSHYRSSGTGSTAVVSVEPTAAACVAPSLMAGEPVTVKTGSTVLSGLNCGTPSMLAWPFIRDGLDGAVAISDADAITAARELADLGVAAGPCGGSGLAAARDVLTGPGSDERRAHLGVDSSSTVLLVITEGSDANPLPE